MTAVAPKLDVSALPRLWLGQIDAGFQPERDAVVGPWCFQGAEELDADWDSRIFESPLDAPGELLAAVGRVQVLIDELAEDWRGRLNGRHGLDRGPDYWDYHLRPWLVMAVSAIYRRYLELADFASRNGTEPYVVEAAANDPDWAPTDLPDLWERVLSSHAFNFWLNSRIVRELCPPAWKLREVELAAPPAACRTEAKPGLLGRLLVHRSESPAGLLERLAPHRRCRHVPGLRAWQIVFSALLSALPAKRLERPALPRRSASAPDPAARRLIETLLPMLLPRSLGEDFAVRDAAAVRPRYWPGKVNLIGPALVMNEAEKFKLAHARAAGELVVCTQHGGQGYQAVPLPLVETEYRQDAYLTWGWTKQADHWGRFVPVPSAMFSRTLRRWTGKGRDLVLVGNASKSFSLRLQTTETQGGYSVETRRAKADFIARLPSDVAESVLYRPYPQFDGTYEDARYFARRFPKLRIWEGELRLRPFYRRLAEARLVAVDHPTTVFSYAMAADIPVIGFWNPDAWPMTEDAAAVFDAFRDAGVIVGGGAEAADRAAEVWEGVADWWQSAPVQTARREFCRRYARTSRLWWWYWMRALKNL